MKVSSGSIAEDQLSEGFRLRDESIRAGLAGMMEKSLSGIDLYRVCKRLPVS